jgi:hypothetical protein
LGYFTTELIIRNRNYAEVQTRNFYGTLSIWEDYADTPDEQRWLLHGVIYHGMQFTDPERRMQATTYFFPETGVGRALLFLDEQQENKRVGILGMGIGTLLAYGNEGDYFRLYEINPDVETYAEQHFTYLADTPAEVDVVLGDGRLSLEREEPQNFDILILDAFASDAVPTHLLTQEALGIYLNHIREGGILAFNVTNRHLDLGPVLTDLAREYDLQAVRLATNPEGFGTQWADWMLLTTNDALIAEFEEQWLATVTTDNPTPSNIRLWTDDYTSLFPIVLWENDLETFLNLP